MRTKLRFLTLSFYAMALLAPFMGQAHETPVASKVNKKSVRNNPMESGNIAYGKPTMASHEEPGHPSSHALDGDSSTYWAGSPHGQWWQVDLHGTYALNILNVVNYYDGERYYRYHIDASIDGVNWTRIVDRDYHSNGLATRNGDTFSVNGINAPYLRVSMKYNSANVGVHLVEFRAFGDLIAPSPNHVNIALNKPTAASNEESGHLSSDAVDGDDSSNSWWGTNPYAQWWQVDLEGVYRPAKRSSVIFMEI